MVMQVNGVNRIWIEDNICIPVHAGAEHANQLRQRGQWLYLVEIDHCGDGFENDLDNLALFCCMDEFENQSTMIINKEHGPDVLVG